MTVDRNKVNAMSDIVARLNALGPDAFEPETGPRTSFVTESPTSMSSDGYYEAAPLGPSHAPVDDAKSKAMGDILARFRDATEGLREDAMSNDDLLEALQTERTSTGVRIAEWQITVFEQTGTPGKFYDLIRDDIKIASDLRLYEAALLLQRELNKGTSITSDKVRRILALEAQYAKNFDEALNYARIVKTATGTKRDVAETRLHEAKNKAMDAKRKINEVR